MFTPHTDAERKEMLTALGLKAIEELFSDVPKQYRFPALKLPAGMTEMQARDYLEGFADANATTKEFICFLGAGAYDHYTPAAVDSILHRGEFFTAYTPYQPEISQGTLQAIFEFQSLICNLTSLDVSNASHYDGATAAAEACITAYSHFREKRKRILLSHSIHPQYREVIATYLSGINDIEIITSAKDENSLSDPRIIKNLINDDTAVVMVQYPDFFGRLFDFTDLINEAHQKGALVCMVVNPTALGLLKTPGQMGADIAVGEGQPLGIPLSFGGPYLGFIAARKELVRKLSGRLVGETVDEKGNRGYVLTLTAREQHIRREKATSNICSNQGLMALAATVYMSLLGKSGMKQVSNLCYQNAHYAARKIGTIEGFEVLTTEPFFHEIVVRCPSSIDHINHHLLEEGILGGYSLEDEFPDLKDCMLLAFTEKTNKEVIDLLCEILKESKHG
ncbi:MAG: aminomethyl-transferring glycine dehydrogenase subunit GcvPA [Anaerolineaceae bacterium]|jgi:glycine dehydrogenase subunit 1|nr:MAG: aminomethyl-transferring glycine dehydrogenase subunit GcvPA [Anaerolineaceae bacterium]